MKQSLKFEIYSNEEFYCARCFDFDIFTQGSTLDELITNIKEAVELYFDDASSNVEKENYDSILTLMEMAI